MRKMLVKFTVGNYLSFKDNVSLCLAASPITEHHIDNVFETNFKELRLLKSCALYGYNSSGKSNFIKAINFVRWFIINSSKDLQAGEDIGVTPFMLSIVNKSRPCYFEAEFLDDEVKYRYGFEVDKSKIHKEWLYYTKKIKEYCLFERIDQKIEIQNKFHADKELFDRTRINALFLSVAAQFNNSMAIDIIKGFRNIKIVSGLTDKRYIDYTANLLNDSKYQDFIQAMLKGGHLGFKNIEAEKVDISEGVKTSQLPDELKAYILKNETKEILIRTEHDVFNEYNEVVGKTYFNLARDESKGTQKFFSLSGPIIETLLEGTILLIDELDARLHSNLSEALIQLFNSRNNNPKNAQLIFTTHDTNYLASKILRRDQIYIIEKDRYGASKGETLYEKRIRKDASYDKVYLLSNKEHKPKINLPYQLTIFDNI